MFVHTRNSPQLFRKAVTCYTAATGRFAAAHARSVTSTSIATDPYRYQTGFGNRFSSESIPDILPHSQNTPQRIKFDLYSEQLNGSSFIAPRRDIKHVWMYRIRPSMAHAPVVRKGVNPHIEAIFSTLNPNVECIASEEIWEPLPLAPQSQSIGVDFVHGIRTIGGQGDPTYQQGLAIHVYSAGSSMNNSAFCNNDGDLLIVPQTGRLDIQTELGWLMVHPGEIAVIQAGIRFRVLLPDGPSRGYIQEVFGVHYDLPELGPLGSNGLALPQHFQSPTASFDLDESPWKINYKLAGELHVCEQDHTPFDVVAWQGNLAPYKYALKKFTNLTNVEKDQADPTVHCVLTAPSRRPGVSLSDFLVFTPKWVTTSNTFRPPYYHRNMSTEVMGLIYGKYGGGDHALNPGSLSYCPSYMPHGETYDTWKEATTKELANERVCEDTAAFMFHISAPMLLTRWAVKGEGAGLKHRNHKQMGIFKAHSLWELKRAKEEQKNKLS